MELSLRSGKTVYRVQALERALDILDAFSHQKRKMNLSDVVHQTGLKKATAKRLLANLTERGYLKSDPVTKQYELGIRLFELGSVVYSGFSLRKVAATYMQWLGEKTGLNILLGQCQEDHLVYVDKQEGTGEINISSHVGQRRQLHFGMLGQTLMAFLPKEKVHRILAEQPLEAFTPNTITDPDVFFLRLAEIRENGFTIERNEAHQGIMGLAAPIRDSSRQVVAAIGAALPMPDYASQDYIENVLSMVRQAAESISAELGYAKA